ncbi:MAG: C4-dicarboxylate transporter DcuC [Veillonellales bacterium]
MVIIGAVITIITFILMLKRYETRMILFCSGLLMTAVSGDVLLGFKAFSNALKQTVILEPIISSMGFAMVLKATECDKHLIQLATRPLRKGGMLVIPLAVIITMFADMAITSAAGVAAALGAIAIPILVAAGVHPAIAASAVAVGTFGSCMNPGYSINVVGAEAAKATSVAVVTNQTIAVAVSALIVSASLLLMAILLKEHKGYQPAEDKQQTVAEDFRVNLLKAVVPLIPLTILFLGTQIPALKTIGISHAMIIGVFCAFAVTRISPAQITKEFWRGMGEAFNKIWGIIVCALVFLQGMEATGLVKAFTTFLISNPAIAKVTSAFGPFFMAVLTGTAAGASVAFNKAVTVYAASFGINPLDMASMVSVGGSIGRAMSPIAGVTVICAGLAGVNPLEIAKRNAPGTILACAATMLILLH